MSHQVTSPLPGVFYRKPGPDKDPYVQEGDHVEAGQTIGVVEIMKQFSEVKTEVCREPGQVRGVGFRHGQPG